MATLTEVLNALVTASAATKPVSEAVDYFPGWPLPEEMKKDFEANKSYVSVYPFGKDKEAIRPLGEKPVKISETDTQATVQKEVSKQIKMFQINIWAKTFEKREAVAEPIKVALDALSHISLNANESGRIRSRGQQEDDSEQRAGIYRRILFYEVEYSTMQTETVYKACQPRIVNADGEVVSPGSGTSVLVNEL